MDTGLKREWLSAIALVLLGVTTACAAHAPAAVVTAPVATAAAPAPTPNTQAPGNVAWVEYQGRNDHNAVFPNAHLTRIRWAAQIGGKINSGLSIVNGALYADSFDHGVYALDLKTGRMLWRTVLPNVVMSTPAIRDGIIVVGTGSNHSLMPVFNAMRRTQEHDAVYAISSANGQILWRFPTQGEDMPSPAIYRNMVLFANGDQHAYALDLHSGRLIWKQQLLGAAAMDSAQIDGGVFFAGSCASPTHCEMRALDALSGKTLWTNPIGSADATPAISDGMVFSGALTSDERYVDGGRAIIAAIDERTGKTVWTRSAGQPGACSSIGTNMRTIPGTVVGGVLYQPVGCSHQLIALDAHSGRTLWSYDALGAVKMSPIVNGNSVYFGDTEGVMYELDKGSGRTMLAVAFGKPFTDSAPVIVGRTMFVANSDVVYAFPLHDRLPRAIPIRNYADAAQHDSAE